MSRPVPTGAGPGDMLAVMDRMRGVMNGDASQDADRVYQESLEARAAVAELVEAAGGGLSDLLAMVAAADRGEVWTVNAGTRLRLEKLAAALAKFGGGA